MNAVILAAGVGSRLRPVTSEKPKCAVTVDGEPILEHQIAAYDTAGITEVVVVAGYMAEYTRDLCHRLDAAYDLDVTVVENERYDETDNAYSLALARDIVGGTQFILSNGDVVFDPVVASVLGDADGSAIACDTSTYSDEGMKITVAEDGRVDHISKTIDRNAAHATSIDAYRFSASFSSALFDELERLIESDEQQDAWTEVAIDALLADHDHDVRPLDIAGANWVEIDDIDDLLVADRAFTALSLASKQIIFFDLDGTLFLDDDPIPGASETIAALRDAGVEIFFLSNNSSKWKTDYAEKLTALGIPAGPEDILLSTDGVIEFLLDNDIESTYVVGTDELRGAIEQQGIAVEASDPEHVVVGFDTDLTYEKVRQATLAIRDGAGFLLVHPDIVCPTADGFVPDCGAIGALIEAATDRQPDRVFGKPNEEMVSHVLAERTSDPSEVLVVGDRLETEIALAENVGCESVCVLTGDADRAAVEASEHSPTTILPDVGHLAAFLSRSAAPDATTVRQR